MKISFTSLLVGAALVLSTGLQAQSSCCQTLTTCMGSGYEYGMNPPVSFADTCSCTWTGHIDYLYWKPYEDCIDWTTITEVNASQIKLKFDPNKKLINFDWDSGFSVGVGYGFPCDKWNLSINWKHYRTDTKKSFTGIGFRDSSGDQERINFSFPFITLPVELVDVGLIDEASFLGKWRMQYNQVDLCLSRRYFAGPCLMLTPYAGVSFLTIKQDMNVCEEFLVSGGQILDRLVGRYRSEFKGVGITAGLDSNWEICSGLGVFAEWNMGAYYGTFDTGHNSLFSEIPLEPTPVAASRDFCYSKDFEALRITNHLEIGVSWMYHFNCDKNFFTFKAGWEHNAFFGQNMFPVLNLLDSRAFGLVVYDATYSKGDLYLYGFRFSFEVGF